MKRLALILLLVSSAISPAVAEDSLRTLSRILASKGLITAEERDRVTRADSTETLVELLVQKGLLTREEGNRIAGPRGAPLVPVAQSPSILPAVLQASPTEAQSQPSVTLYGTILWNAFYNSEATNNQDVPLFPAKRGADPFDNLGMTVRQSRLGLRYQGPPVAGARLSAQAEVDFFGGKTGLANGINMDLVRLRLGYVRLDWSRLSLLAGQDWSIFAPLNPTSLAGFAIPALAGAGNPWIRIPQIRAELQTRITDARLQWLIAATDPNAGDYAATSQAVRTPGVGEHGAIPGIETRLSAGFRMAGRDAAVGVSSRYHRGANAGTLAGLPVEHAVDSWGIAMDFTAPLHRRFAIMGEAYEGRALGAFSVSLGQAVLPAGTPGEHGVEARGGWMQAQYDIATRWQANAAYGLELPDISELRLGDRSKSQAYIVNLMFKPSPRLTLAWEWRRLLSNYKEQPSANNVADHANVAVGYAF
jgi:hypothetical protein